jgi:hypothetical protein
MILEWEEKLQVVVQEQKSQKAMKKRVRHESEMLTEELKRAFRGMERNAG